MKTPLERSAIIVPKEFEDFASSFATNIEEGLFLGDPSTERDSIQRAQFTRTRRMAMFKLKEANFPREPNQQVVTQIIEAAKDFFSLTYKLLTEKNEKFPLAGLNKCLGMVVVPTTNVVMLGISQSKIADKAEDTAQREQMVHLLNLLNKKTKKWRFELVCIPTKSQYLMPRTFFMKTPHKATEESVNPRTRCVEVALMVALCKAGRFIKFNPEDISILTFSATLWANPNQTSQEAIDPFKGVKRNTSYLSQDPIEVKLTDSLSGWIDIWEPCKDHCQRYRKEMLAIAVSGGPATSFLEPRSESNEIPAVNRP